MTKTYPEIPAERQDTVAPIPTLVSPAPGAHAQAIVSVVVTDGILAIEVKDRETADFILSCFNGEGEMVAMFSPEEIRLLEWDSGSAMNLDIPARMSCPPMRPVPEGPVLEGGEFESPVLPRRFEGHSPHITDDGAAITSPEEGATTSAWMALGASAPEVHTYVLGMGEEGLGFGRVDRCEWYFGALPPVDEYLALRTQGLRSGSPVKG